MGRGRKRRRVVSDEELETDRDDHVSARLVLSDKPGLSRLRLLARGGTLDSGGTGVRTGSPRLPGPRVVFLNYSFSFQILRLTKQ